MGSAKMNRPPVGGRWLGKSRITKLKEISNYLEIRRNEGTSGPRNCSDRNGARPWRCLSSASLEGGLRGWRVFPLNGTIPPPPPAAGKLFSNCLRSGKGPLIGLDKLRSFNWNGVAPPRIIMESNVSMGWLGYRIFFFVYRYEFVVCWFLMEIWLVGKLE